MTIRIYAPKCIFKFRCDNTISDHQQSGLHLLALTEFRHNQMICLYPSQKHRDDLSLLSAILRAPCKLRTLSLFSVYRCVRRMGRCCQLYQPGSHREEHRGMLPPAGALFVSVYQCGFMSHAEGREPAEVRRGCPIPCRKSGQP